MNSKSKGKIIAVLGAGNMGSAVAQILAQKGHRVLLWDYDPQTVSAIRLHGENKKFLPGVKLSPRVLPQADMQQAVEKAALVVIAVASSYVRSIARHLAHCLESAGHEAMVAHVAKGLEEKTFLTMHEVVQSELAPRSRRNVTTIAGPSLAKEFVRGIPTAVVAASESPRARELVKKVFESKTFRVATSGDIAGVGICSALKNVYAIAVGMCDGMRFAMNAKAFMVTAALQETERIVKSFGGARDTVYGLAGVGDLIVTALGEGRNRALGERICREGSCRFVFKEKGATTYEGVAAAKILRQFVRTKQISAPLLEMVYRVLYRGTDPCAEVRRFFAEFRG